MGVWWFIHPIKFKTRSFTLSLKNVYEGWYNILRQKTRVMKLEKTLVSCVKKSIQKEGTLLLNRGLWFLDSQNCTKMLNSELYAVCTEIVYIFDFFFSTRIKFESLWGSNFVLGYGWKNNQVNRYNINRIGVLKPKLNWL